MYVNCDTAKKYILIINFFARGVADKGKIKKRKRVTLISSPDNVLYYSDSQTASIIESDASQGLCIDHHFDCSTLKTKSANRDINENIYNSSSNCYPVNQTGYWRVFKFFKIRALLNLLLN